MSWNTVDPAHRELAEKLLTRRQFRVLQLRLDERTWDQIGYALGITEATARGHFEAALRKLKPHIGKNAAA